MHCEACGEVAVPDDQLPVELPDLRGADLKPKGISPLAAAEDWVNVDCPQCGGPAKRDTDTMDTFVDSSWYFLRYCSPDYTDGPFDPEAVREWMPAAQYVGGVEHAILHLLYSRFFTKVLHDMGMVDFVEPFSALMNQGQVINQGKAMSKSLGNGVNLGEMIDAYGVDAVRLTMVFAGPPEDDIDWADVSPVGLAEVPAARLAAGRRRHVGCRARRRTAATWRCARPPTAPCTRPASWSRATASTCWWPGSWSWSTPPARRSTPAAARPTRRCARRPRPSRSCCAWSRRTPPRRCGSGWATSPRWRAPGGPSSTRRCWSRTPSPRSCRCRARCAPGWRCRPDVTDADLEAAAMAETAVQRALDGQTVRKVIVRAPKLVNIVAS